GRDNQFPYLMALNTLAGRSYNDLMQYPVFPWILANYKSEELDLTNPESFRDLSKPMGAQTPQRLEQFMKRYTEWEDPHTDSPPYHYGTHYSSAMIVSSYMVRCEPFTQHFLHLQGGHFDLPDRMFHSVEEAWDSASRNNMADVRELIPEFFYLSDFFSNHNHFELGTKQNGEVLDDVILPPWAKGSPEEFIRLHREALESDYVSSHLHEWIDLIFGYKQSGPPAMEATNVFHHLFYEGSVDIFAIEDPLQRNATIGFINNFGQIPKNLFKKPHPSKKIYDGSLVGNNSHSSSLGVFFHNLTNLRPSISPIKELKGPVGQIVHGERVYVVEHNKVLVPGNLNRYLAWGNNDQSFRLCNYESDKAIFICEPNYLIGQVLSCVMPNSKTVITAGTSSVIAVYEYLKKLRQLHIKKLLYGHTDAVTCLTASPSWNIAVSGSRDRTAIVWDLSRYAYVKHLVGHIGPIAAVAINELTGDIITTSGSWLYLWDINGRLQASVDTASKTLTTQILCVACSEFREWDRENVIITGSSDGVVRMWSLDYVEVPVSRENSPKKTVKPSKRRQSQSTTDSSEGGFVLLGGDESSKPPINDGYIWKKDLILRAKLTMHTAFERPDNGDPAAVTALAISKDHKIVYVGDEKGRVFSWTVSSRPGKGMN
ncbi:WD repeat and FYVE domain-containing protein, partial [Caligus rogercresseyi]